MLRSAWMGALLAASLAGCGGASRLSCEGSPRYADSPTIAPVAVPEDLAPPDETRSLRIPPAPDRAEAPTQVGRCLELPPDYFETREPAESAEVGAAFQPRFLPSSTTQDRG